MKTEQHKNKPSYAGNSIMVRPDGPLICKGDNEITLLSANAELILKRQRVCLVSLWLIKQ